MTIEQQDSENPIMSKVPTSSKNTSEKPLTDLPEPRHEENASGASVAGLQKPKFMVNPVLQRMLGYNEEKLKEMSYRDITPPKYLEEDKRQLQCLQENGSYGPFCKEYQTRQGQRIPVVLNGIAHSQTDGSQYVWSFIQRQQPDNTNAEGRL